MPPKQQSSTYAANPTEGALWGAQTQRAVENFGVAGGPLPKEFIAALAQVKAAAAVTNQGLAGLNKEIAEAIVDACEQLASGELWGQFPVDVFQTGSGTSSNMNINEVIADISTARLGKRVHPNDHVNMSQSSNDVIPTAIHVSALLLLNQQLLPALQRLIAGINKRAEDWNGIVKTGRTHLMDAMPIRVSQELGGWAAQLSDCHARLIACQPRLRQIAQGGTAVGTGVNAPKNFANEFAKKLSERCGESFTAAENPFSRISSQDTAVELSGQLKTLAVALMKIANDLRWMSSGPLIGLGELQLPELQPGSSIMPGKVNPVIPEAVTMIAADVIGNDSAITIAGQSGNFQLNVMLPLIADRLLRSLRLLSHAMDRLQTHCIADMTINTERLQQGLAQNPILVTALNTEIGYDLAATIAKKAYEEERPILEVALELTDLPKDRLEKLLDPKRLT